MNLPFSDPATSPAAHDLVGGVDVGPLFTPYSIGGMELANRFVMAPMTRRFSPGGVPGPDVAAYYARRAAHVGLIVTEGTYVGHPSAGESDRVPRFYGEDALAGWAGVADAVHEAGGTIVPQLWHLGAARAPGAPPHPHAPVVSPSGVDSNGAQVGEPANAAEIAQVITAFADAARDAKAAGFDGVELHAAHGYLLDQFMWSVTNRRSDGYGGSPANRARIIAEILTAIREQVGPEFPVIVRFSQWKSEHYDARSADTPAELEQLLTPMVEAGASALHVSTRRYWQPAFDGSERTLAGWTKTITGLPVIAIGSVGVAHAFRDSTEQIVPLNLGPLLEIFDRGEFDLVALGRALLSEPAWPTKLRHRQIDDIRPYDKDDGARLT